MSERRSHLVLVALIGLALVGAALLAIPGSPLHRSPRLGLDLQGGLEVVLRAKPEADRPLRKTDMDRSLEIIRNRVDKLGVAEPTIAKQGENQISIQLPGIKNPEDAQRLIGKTAKLELFDLETSLVGPSAAAQGFPVAEPSLYNLLSSAATTALTKKSPAENGPYYLFQTKTKKVVAGPAPSERALLRERDGEVPKGERVLAVPPKTVIVTCGAGEVVCPGVNEEYPDRTYYYLFKFDPKGEKPVPQMTGEDLKLSGTRQDFDSQTGEPIVLMQFTDEGGDKFQDITRDEWIRGRTANSPQHFAIVLDREIKSFPQIDYTDGTLSNGIGGGSAQITGIASLKEAKEIALVLQTGALPIEFVTLEQTEISATLGEDSLKQAQRAAIAGLLIVALFLLLFYRFLGLVAVIGLGIYAVFLYAMILVFNVTLTLPGFAGMILTIGVAADANVVVFERIKEESRAGKSVRAAIATGYGKGFATIIDANVVTAITALVLFALATAGVKGFALMLLIGTAMSIVTAVFATRAMLGLLAGFRWFNSPRFMGAEGTQVSRWIQHDYVGKRRIWFAVSGVVVVLAAGALAVKGLNLGIDFKGGTELSFRTPQATALADVRAEADEIGAGGAYIQGIGSSDGDRYREFQIRTEALDRGEQSRLQDALEERFAATSFGANTVSASFGRQIAEGAVYAILFSLFLVVAYISFRFQWKFALATIVALLHDVLIAVGIYALIGKEVSTATVAAILTVLGYSIYDSIIILDRVRENIPLMRRASFATIGNVSLWETIRRSLATTFITLLPIATLYFFGGETLKDFAFALLVGIGSGAYSSIFLAVPLVAVLKEREPEYARRKDVPVTAETSAALVEEATEAAAEEPVPQLVPVGSRDGRSSEAKRERRRERRRARPHGRPR